MNTSHCVFMTVQLPYGRLGIYVKHPNRTVIRASHDFWAVIREADPSDRFVMELVFGGRVWIFGYQEHSTQSVADC